MGVVINLANDDAGLKLLVQEGVCQQVVSALGRRGFTTLREVRENLGGDGDVER